MTGWSGATFAMADDQVVAAFGTTLDVALGHLATDIANSTAWGGLGALSSGNETAMAGAGRDDCGDAYRTDDGLHCSEGGIEFTPLLVVATDRPSGIRRRADVPLSHGPLRIEWATPEPPATVRLELKLKPRLQFLDG